MPTREEIEASRTPAGGWSRKQLAEWGVGWPPPKGWKTRLERAATTTQRRSTTTHHRCTEHTCTHMPGFDPIFGPPPTRPSKPSA